MKNRMKDLRKTLGLTQQQFADKIGIKQNTIAQYETGRNEPITPIINCICREFNVNENWLRNGEGEIFINTTCKEENTKLTNINEILHIENTNLKKRLIKTLSTVTNEEWILLENLARKLLEKD